MRSGPDLNVNVAINELRRTRPTAAAGARETAIAGKSAWLNASHTTAGRPAKAPSMNMKLVGPSGGLAMSLRLCRPAGKMSKVLKKGRGFQADAGENQSRRRGQDQKPKEPSAPPPSSAGDSERQGDR